MDEQVLDFGEWLRRKRGGLGLTQVEFAQSIGCAPITLRKFETGERRPSREMAMRLATCLGLPAAQHEVVARFARGDVKAFELLQTPAPALTGESYGNVPAAPYALVGRDQLLAAAAAMLQKPDTRILSMIGPPGVGKTRLAIELGHRVAPSFADGARFVELVRIEQPDLLASAIASALRLHVGKSITAADAVIANLRPRRILLILDNFEHLLHANDQSMAALLIARIAAHCPGVVCVLTSRERVRLRAEQVLLVPPLALAEDPHSAESVSASPAAGMFTARARAITETFSISRQNAATIAALCAQVDGLPLALELLAARIDEASPGQLLDELRAGMPVNASLADLPARHQSIDTAIDWSMSRLSAGARTLLACLSVFVGGFDEQAAQAVCPHPPGDLQALRRAHLVTGEDRRMLLLEPIRQYGQRKLADDEPAVALRHAAHFGALAQRARNGLIGPQQAEWQVTLDAEHANLQSALRWSLAHGRPLHALEIAQGIWRYWHQRGFVREGVQWLQAALELDDSAAPHLRAEPGLKAFALRAAGTLYWALGRYAQADVHMRASLQMGLALDDVENISGALTGLGMVNVDWGRFDDAMKWLDDAIVYNRAHAAVNLKFPVQIKSGLLKRLGRLDEARALYEESLQQNEALGDIEGITGALHGLADVALLAGDESAASAHILRARALSLGIKHRRRLAWNDFLRGRLLMAQGNFKEAVALLRQSLMEHHAIDDTASLLDVLQTMAACRLALDNPAEAAGLLGAVEAGYAAMEAGMTDYEQQQQDAIARACHARLTPRAFENAKGTGARRWPQGVLFWALDDSPGG